MKGALTLIIEPNDASVLVTSEYASLASIGILPRSLDFCLCLFCVHLAPLSQPLMFSSFPLPFFSNVSGSRLIMFQCLFLRLVSRATYQLYNRSLGRLKYPPLSSSLLSVLVPHITHMHISTFSDRSSHSFHSPCSLLFRPASPHSHSAPAAGLQ